MNKVESQIYWWQA